MNNKTCYYAYFKVVLRLKFIIILYSIVVSDISSSFFIISGVMGGNGKQVFTLVCATELLISMFLARLRCDDQIRSLNNLNC